MKSVFQMLSCVCKQNGMQIILPMSDWVFDLELPWSILVSGESLGSSATSQHLMWCHQPACRVVTDLPSGVTAVFSKAVVDDAVGCNTESPLSWSWGQMFSGLSTQNGLISRSAWSILSSELHSHWVFAFTVLIKTVTHSLILWYTLFFVCLH